MTKKTRSILFLVFVIAFLFISPLLLMYAYGYGFNFKNLKLQKTSTIIIETEPKNATISLNDIQLEKPLISWWQKISNQSNLITSPAKIKNLEPKEYTIKLEKEGYWPWESKYDLKPEQSLFLKTDLFKKSLPLLTINQKLITNSKIIATADFKKIAFASVDSLVVMDLDNNLSITFPIETKIDSIAWSNDGQRILVDNKIFNLKNKSNIINLNELFKNDIKFSHWNEYNNDEVVYLGKNGLTTFNIIDSKITNLLPVAKDNIITDYLVKNNYLYILLNDENLKTSSIKIFNSDKKIIGDIKLPMRSTYSFINRSNNNLNIFDSTNKKLHILETMLPLVAEYSLKSLDNDYSNGSWVNDENLLYCNNFEIWTWNKKNNQSELITRISQPLISLSNHKNNKNIFYNTNDNLSYIEYSENKQNNQTDILSKTEIKDIFLDNLNNKLYFLGTIGNQSGLYKLDL